MILRLRGGREVSCDLDVFQNRTEKNARMNSREDGVHERASWVRSEVNSELNFPPNFEGLVVGCIDADFCK